MEAELFKPPLIATGVFFLMVFLVYAFLSERYGDENIQTDIKPARSVKPAAETNLETHDFYEWWTPQELDVYANEIAVKNENMAALVGHHNVMRFDNVIFPIVRQWYTNDKGEDMHGNC